LVRLAKAAGLDVLAVTDHDTTDALDEAVAEGARAGVKVVAGIEVSSITAGQDVHILGIGVDRANAEFQATLTKLKESRRARVDKICSALAAVGVTLAPADVLAQAGGKSVGRKHVAKALLAKGAVKSIEEAFARYLSPGQPAHVPANELTPADAARLVRRAGGVPVLAHPGFFRDDALVERIIDESGVRGIEVYHQYESPQLHLRYLEMAQRRDLIATGGSDFHGDEHPNNGGLGSFVTPADQWQRLERLLG
jgi:hypothetical protein